MSSSSDSPQIRLSLSQSASSFKRSFDQFGFDLESPLDSAAVASSSGTDEHRPGPSNSDRNKRARSNSVTPNSAEQAHSTDSSPSSSSSHTMSSASSNHALANHSNPPPAAAAVRHPQTPENDPVFPYSLGEQLTHTSFPLFDPRPLEASPGEPPTASAWSNSLSSTGSSTEQNDQFHLSMERFHAFDSQISTIRSRPSPLPLRVPPTPTLPRLTHSSPIEHSDSHTGLAVSLPSVESSTSRPRPLPLPLRTLPTPTLPRFPLSSPIEHSDPHISPTTPSRPSVESSSYTSTSTHASAPVPPQTVPPSTTSPDRHHSNMSPLRFEEFGEFREMMGLLQGQNPTSPNIERPTVRHRHQSPPLPDNSERPHIGQPFRRPTPGHIVQSISRNPSVHSWRSDRRDTIPDDPDDEFGGRSVVTNIQDRGSLDLPRSRLNASLLAGRRRRSMENQMAHPALDRMSPPPFPAVPPSQVEPNTPTHLMNGSRTQEPGRHNRHEPWSIHPPSRLPVFAEAVRTLAERLGRARQRTSYGSERRAERSRSPGASAFPSLYLVTLLQCRLSCLNSYPPPQAQCLLHIMIGPLPILNSHHRRTVLTS